MNCEVLENLEQERRKEFNPILRFGDRSYVDQTIKDLERCLESPHLKHSTEDLLKGLIGIFNL